MGAKTAYRWLTTTTFIGASVWLILLSIRIGAPQSLTSIELLFIFGVAVTTPLAMRLALQPDRQARISSLYRLAIYTHLLVIGAVSAAVLVDSGLFAIGLAGVWFVQTLLLALSGLKRFVSRPIIAMEELCIDFGLLYVPISGIWFLAYAADYALLSFDSTTVLLTAVHFTFISPGALVIAGMIGRQLRTSRVWPIYRVIAATAILSPLLVATGISVTQFSGWLWIEAGSVIILAASFLLLALLCFFGGLPEKISARVLILLSSAALFLTMTLALGYSVGRLTGMWSIPLEQMVRWHGWFNATGFTFFGLLAWNIDRPATTLAAPGIPFSHLPWRWHIGPAYFQETGAIDDDCNVSPTGIVDRLTAYNRDGFEAQSISPAITAFYEQTADHELLVYPEWQPGFGFLARIYKQFSQRVGQMNFPLQPESDETLISSDIVPLRDTLDGREQVRGWVRIYPETGRAVYVAAYSSHWHQECRYMNIAFPLPSGNLTSILRLETLEDCKTGVLLTSFSTRQGDQGVYFANRLVPIRLPINETIRVYPGNALYEGYPADFPVGAVIAEHKMWILGIHCLTLHYSIRSM